MLQVVLLIIILEHKFNEKTHLMKKVSFNIW
ncbi:hypothetical protein QF044_004189 [Chryseobacterium sp. W4I1]|nr:hypothetical protein [Chryseobacterium sp. W4I1]